MMRYSWALVACIVAIIGCTADLSRNATGGTCTTNSNCNAPLICISNTCAVKLDCSVAANQSDPQCSTPCKGDTDCVNGLVCDVAQNLCVAAPVCTKAADCKAPNKACVTFPEASQNFCAKCGTSADCLTGQKCIANSCQGTPTNPTCKVNTDCKDAADPVCNSGDCVQCTAQQLSACKTTETCSNFKCVPINNGGDCTKQPCPDDSNEPICNTTTKQCEACATTPANAPQGDCPTAGSTCNTAAGQNQGSCTIPGCDSNTGDHGCLDFVTPAANAGTALPTPDTAWCNKAVTPGVCALCSNNSQCTSSGSGFTCDLSNDATTGYCIPPATSGCTSAAQCAAPTPACVNGACSATCTTGSQCPLVNNIQDLCLSGTCTPPPACSASTPCPDNLACINKVCGPCSKSEDCPVGDTCDTSSGTCVVQSGANKADGAICTLDSECNSGLCFTLEIGGVPSSFCTRVCERSNTAVGVAAPAAAQDDCAGPATVAGTGFSCLTNLFIGTQYDGLSLCLPRNIVADYLPASTPPPADAYSVAAGAAPTASGDGSCESGEIDPVTGMCAASCGSTTDCQDPALTGFSGTVCQSALTQLPDFSETPTGQRTCEGPTSGIAGGAGPGDSCNDARTCGEQACGGFCFDLAVPVPGNPSCSTTGDCDACPVNSKGQGFCKVGGQPCKPATAQTDCPFFCNAGVCSTSTIVKSGCSTDADCGGANVCRDNICFSSSAITGQPCQDFDGCQVGEQCYGSCLFHCNNVKDCQGAKNNQGHAAFSDQTACGYWVMQPTKGAGEFVGTVWERTCRAWLPITGSENHTQGTGASCSHDTDCGTEVCVVPLGQPAGYCSDYCGRAAACDAGYHCGTLERQPYPGAPNLVTPVCLLN